ncbi:efflux RND transporter periplasmic adaptor subunit [Hydrogenophaga sp. 5NK40-0174]|uniref:efflux RND transporter periplasmic adaptor subunit n=1 Tax=Hydrogenophaga sp. 5NK40-0174 TaxID=3127649 RepID=UPI0031078CA2
MTSYFSKLTLRRIRQLSAPFALVGALSASGLSWAAGPAGAQPAAPAATVSMSEPVRALVIAAGETTLASPVAGRIVMVYAALGQPFSKGRVLVKLDCDEHQAKLAMAKAELAAANDQYEAKLRMQGLEQASDVEVSLAASEVAKNKAQVDLQQFQISQCSIRAPWAGNTANLHVKNYMSVTAGQPLLDLVRSGHMRVKANVPSKWLKQLAPGNRFSVKVDETGKTYEARLRLINSRIDPVSQTIEVEGTMLELHEDLLPGMSGQATFSSAN